MVRTTNGADVAKTRRHLKTDFSFDRKRVSFSLMITADVKVSKVKSDLPRLLSQQLLEELT